MRAAAIGFPLWLLLLLVLGWAGAGPVGGLVGASVGATIVVLVCDLVIFRRFARSGWNDRVVRLGSVLAVVAPLVLLVLAGLGVPDQVVVWGGAVAIVLGGLAIAVLSALPPRQRSKP